MSPQRLVLSSFLVACLIPIAPTVSAVEKPATPAGPMPRPELTPDRVIEIQLEALQFNDRPSRDAGIATTFRFASPGNREVTGPVERFTLIVKGPAFLPLINHRIAGYGPIVVREGLALRRVTVVAADGQALDYEFRLSIDPGSKCWFTDGVIPIPTKAPIDPGKVARSAQTLPSSRLESFLHLL